MRRRLTGVVGSLKEEVMNTRWTRRDGIVWAGVLLTLAFASVATATPPWKKLVPFRSVEADPNKMYWLTEDQGPWMIMATSFAGPGAEEQAHTLVLELRKPLQAGCVHAQADVRLHRAGVRPRCESVRGPETHAVSGGHQV